eukprot:TRINITY_DN6790_c0_g1_i1.p1 TRINITY_DN6790_c0_g1~~TRINITY_DN6790_c0_g1_i1.p1  ORF type:complete len:669 (+),score=176.12 TRINITY_DN6790_c0_g1_i1:41-2047(+)
MESQLDLDILRVFRGLKDPITYWDIRDRLLFHWDRKDRVKHVRDEFLSRTSRGKIGNGLVAKGSLKRSGTHLSPAGSRGPKSMTSPEIIDLTDPYRGQGGSSSSFTSSSSSSDIVIDEGPSGSTPPRSEEDEVTASASKESTHQVLLNIFPQVDPRYLYERVEEFHGRPPQELQAWTSSVLEDKQLAASLPSLADYETRRQKEELIQKFSRECDPQELIQLYGNPLKHFVQEARRSGVSQGYRNLSLAYLCLEFRYHRKNLIELTFREQKERFLAAFLSLKSVKERTRKTRRLAIEVHIPPEGDLDIAFLKEYQVAKKVDDIERLLLKQDKERSVRVAEAREKNALKTCGCCFDDELLLGDMKECPSGHSFCKDCIIRGSEVASGDGKSGLQCLNGCCDFFTLSTLQASLPVNLFSKWLPRIQNAEIKDASLEGLAECPFCPYMTIMDTEPSENKVLICMNPECGKESCRLCRELSHLPLHCDEVEKNDEVRKRTFIENKMTEALLRTCPKCQKKFFKEDGCNKITCSCGTSICYLCRAVIKVGYKHFFGEGSVPLPGLCPLFSDNQRLMENDVARGAAEGLKEAEKKQPNVELKIDPTLGVSKKVLENNDPSLAHKMDIIRDQFPGLPPEQVEMEQARIEREIMDPPGPLGLLGFLIPDMNIFNVFN